MKLQLRNWKFVGVVCRNHSNFHCTINMHFSEGEFNYERTDKDLETEECSFNSWNYFYKWYLPLPFFFCTSDIEEPKIARIHRASVILALQYHKCEFITSCTRNQRISFKSYTSKNSLCVHVIQSEQIRISKL